jgi:hypothetical protein
MIMLEALMYIGYVVFFCVLVAALVWPTKDRA